MEPEEQDNYDFTEEDLKEIEKMAQLTDEELEKINDEVEHRWRQNRLDLNAYFRGIRFDPEEYRNRLINKKKEEKMARTRKRYWLDNKAPENIDNEGHLFIALQNEGNRLYRVQKGEAYAQGVFTKFLTCGDENDNIRKSGIGSTNKKEGNDNE